jgi:hypothetical protein
MPLTAADFHDAFDVGYDCGYHAGYDAATSEQHPEVDSPKPANVSQPEWRSYNVDVSAIEAAYNDVLSDLRAHLTDDRKFWLVNVIDNLESVARDGWTD